MKYTKEERLDIGRRIYDGEIGRHQADEEYDIGEQTVRNYMRMYRELNRLHGRRSGKWIASAPKPLTDPVGMEEFESMTMEKLIMELLKARIAETRRKRLRGNGDPSNMSFIQAISIILNISQLANKLTLFRK